MKILNFIRTRSREQWSALASERWTNARIWLQENGELGAVAAFFLGIFLVLAWKFVLVVLLVGIALVLAAWFYAQSESSRNNSDHSNLNGHSS